jgi:hypothetical protein
VSPYTISVGWYAYTAVQTGGSLKGYVLSYNVKGNPRKKNISLPSYPPWLTLENLRILTEYEIRVLVYNEKGVSPLANITCKTEEGGMFLINLLSGNIYESIGSMLHIAKI